MSNTVVVTSNQYSVNVSTLTSTVVISPVGQAGVGVPIGGTTGQALVKASNNNYATEWQTITAGVESVNGQTGNVVLNVSDLNDTNITNVQAEEVLKWNGTAWINGIGGAPELQRRHSFEQPYSYCGFADDGESEASNVWSITRINVALDGTATTGSATNVNWTNRSTHTYT
jgi:hypothetical protein